MAWPTTRWTEPFLSHLLNDTVQIWKDFSKTGFQAQMIRA